MCKLPQQACCSRKTASSGPAAASAGSSPTPSPASASNASAPFEEVLGGPGQHLEIKRTQVERQPASEFVAPGVGVTGREVWPWESVLIRDGEPVAMTKRSGGWSAK
jgi:DNA-binding GntR family transcriptional regulator